MYKKPVFVSFDFDNDKALKDFIIGQSRLDDSPFNVIDHSLKEAAPEGNWEQKARSAIGRVELVIVMVGPYTYRAPYPMICTMGLLAWRAMATSFRTPADGNYTPVPNAGRLYRWSWDTLKKFLA